MVSEQSKTTLKNTGISIGSITGAILTFYALYSYNLFAEIDKYHIFGYTISQFLFLCLIIVGISLIIGPVLFGQKSVSSAKSEINDFLQQSTGTSEKQLKHLGDELKTDATSRIKNKFSVNAVKKIASKFRKNRDMKWEITGMKSPSSIDAELHTMKYELLGKLQTLRFNSNAGNENSAYIGAVNSTDETGENLGEMLKIEEKSMIDLNSVELYQSYSKRRLKYILVFILLAAILYATSFLIRMYA